MTWKKVPPFCACRRAMSLDVGGINGGAIEDAVMTGQSLEHLQL